MAKLRVYQLARELNRDNAEIIRELQHMGVPVTSHSNTVEDRLADRLRRELGVFSPDGGKRASAGDDDFVAVDVPDEEVAVAEPPAVEPEPPHVEAKAEAKAEPKPEPKIEEKPLEPKVAAPPVPVASTPVAAPPVPQAPPPAPPKVEQPAAAQPAQPAHPVQPAQPVQPPQPPKTLTTPSG